MDAAEIALTQYKAITVVTNKTKQTSVPIPEMKAIEAAKQKSIRFKKKATSSNDGTSEYSSSRSPRKSQWLKVKKIHSNPLTQSGILNYNTTEDEYDEDGDFTEEQFNEMELLTLLRASEDLNEYKAKQAMKKTAYMGNSLKTRKSMEVNDEDRFKHPSDTQVIPHPMNDNSLEEFNEEEGLRNKKNLDLHKRHEIPKQAEEAINEESLMNETNIHKMRKDSIKPNKQDHKEDGQNHNDAAATAIRSMKTHGKAKDTSKNQSKAKNAKASLTLDHKVSEEATTSKEHKRKRTDESSTNGQSKRRRTLENGTEKQDPPNDGNVAGPRHQTERKEDTVS